MCTFSIEDDNGEYLRYAFGRTDSWEINLTTIEQPSDNVRAGIGSFGVDANNTIHYAYLDSFPFQYSVLYATLSNGVWQSETAYIPTTGSTGGSATSHLNQVSLALDNQDEPHVVIPDGNTIRHLFRLNGIWQSEIAATSNASRSSQPRYNAIEFDQSGVLYICYDDTDVNQLGRDLYCANNSGGVWSKEVVDTGVSLEAVSSLGSNFGQGWLGTGIDLEIDNNSNLHISYFSRIANVNGFTEEYFMRYSTNASGEWEVSTREITLQSSRINNVNTTNIFIFENGNVGIAYLDHINFTRDLSDIYFLSWDGASWDEDSIDQGNVRDGPVGLYSSLAFDSQGISAVTYNTRTSQGFFGDINYAFQNSNGTWMMENPIPEDIPNLQGSLQNIWNGFDSIGQPHVLFHGERIPGRVGIGHAWKVGSNWLTEIIPFIQLPGNLGLDDRGVVQKGFSVFMDENDILHTAHLICDASTRQTLLIYSTNLSGNWESEIAYDYGHQSLPRPGFESCPEPWITDVIKADNGDVYISFLYRHSNANLNIDQNLRQVRKQGAEWSLLLNEDVLASDDRDFVSLYVGINNEMDVDLKTDKDGSIHFVYNANRRFGATSFPLGLRYSRFKSGAWKHRHLAWGPFYDGSRWGETRNPSIALKDDGHAVVSFAHTSYDDVRIIDTSNTLNSSSIINAYNFDNSTTNPFALNNDISIKGELIRTTFFDSTTLGLTTALKSNEFDVQITSAAKGYMDIGNGLYASELLIKNIGVEPFCCRRRYFLQSY